MKLFLVIVLLTASQVVAQIPPGANSIVVKTRSRDSEVYPRLMDILRHQGWKRDHEISKQFVSLFKPTQNQWQLRLITSVRAGTVKLQGENTSETNAAYIENGSVQYKGQTNEINMVHFGYLNKIALQLSKSIPGSVIEYTTTIE